MSETSKGKNKRRKPKTDQVCRECRHLHRKLKEGVYHCDVKNQDYRYGTIAKTRSKPCEHYEVGKLDAVSAMPVGAQKIVRYTEYRCIACGAIMADDYSFDECYCNDCKGENEVDREKINKYLDDNELLSGLLVAVIESTVRDYIDILKKIIKTHENDRLGEMSKADRLRTLLAKKQRFEKYLFSNDFRKINVADLNPNIIIEGSQQKVGYDERTHGA